MSIIEIVAEIDAALFCLRQARDLLRGPERADARPVAGRKSAKVRVAKRSSTADIAAQIRQIPQQRETTERRAASEVSSSDSVVPLGDSPSDERTVIQATPIKQDTSIEAEAQLPVGPKRAQRADHRRGGRLRAASVTKTARLASPLESRGHLRVVVVSAEAAKKTRDKVTPVVMKHTLTPASPESSRRAFEALFRP